WLGLPAGVPPPPQGHGGGRQRERRGASRDQLPGGQAGPDGVRAEAGGGAAGTARGAGGGDAQGGGVPPRGQPAGALGAAGAEAKAQAEQAPEPAAPRRQTGAQPREVVLAGRAVRGGWRTRGQPNVPRRERGGMGGAAPRGPNPGASEARGRGDRPTGSRVTDPRTGPCQ